MKLHHLYAMQVRALAECRLRAYSRLGQAIDRRITRIGALA